MIWYSFAISPFQISPVINFTSPGSGLFLEGGGRIGPFPLSPCIHTQAVPHTIKLLESHALPWGFAPRASRPTPSQPLRQSPWAQRA